MVLRATVDRPRAVCGAVASHVDAAGARSRTSSNLLSLNRGYNYGMISVTGRRPFSELGDQQLLEQTRRLAANQRCIDVHILDHLDEIDRRGLALRRGFSSLFDYAVRELRFSDAAAQRRIQAMRLCRRHGWVRASLQSGELSMTSAGQLETTFAGAERAERQSHTGHRNVGQGRGHDQDHDCAGGTRQLGLPAAPGEADEQGERGHRSAPGFAPPAAECSGDVRERGHRLALGFAPPAGECSGDVAARSTPAVPVASRAGAQAPGAGHAGALLPRPELNGNASPFSAPSCAPVAAPGSGAGAGSAAPSSDEGPAPLLLPPTDLPASASGSTPVPEPVMAPAESRHTASRAPEPLRDDPFAELSPGTVSAAPLLHPQRQRELIEQAAGMSTRQVASLLAAAAPEVLPPRDTLRAVAPDRYTLKVSIDQECEQGLRLLKDLMSHLDPRMSWGDLVARVVREAVARHDPRGGGSGQRRRRSAGSAGASPRRAPKETRTAAPGQRVDELSPRAPNKTRATGAAAGPAQRVDKSSGRAPNRTRAAVAPVVPARRTGGATPAPPGNTAATERQNPIGVLANAAPPSQSAPAAPLDGARAGGVPSGASAATSAPQSAPAARLDGAHAGDAPSGTPAATSAPQSAPVALLDGARTGGAPSGAPAATSAPQSAPAALLDGARARGVPSGAHAATSAPQSTPAARLDGARAGGAPSGASAATSAPQSAPAALLDGARAGGAPSGAPAATSAPQSAPAVLLDDGPRRRCSIGRARRYCGAAAGTSGTVGWRPRGRRSIGRVRRYCGAAVRVRRLGGWLPCRRRRAGLAGRHFGAGAGTWRVPWRRTERRVGRSSGWGLGDWLLCARRCAGLADRHCGGEVGARRVPRRRTARRISRCSGAHDPRFCSQPPPIHAAAPYSGGCPTPRLATRRRTLLLSRSALRAALHLFPSAADRPPVASRPGRWPGAVQLGSALLCSSQDAPRIRTGCAATAPDVAPPPRCWRAARLRWPTACRWPGGDTLRSSASPACIFATASSDPGRSLSMRSRAALSWSPVYDCLPLPAFAAIATSPPWQPAGTTRCHATPATGRPE